MKNSYNQQTALSSKTHFGFCCHFPTKAKFFKLRISDLDSSIKCLYGATSSQQHTHVGGTMIAMFYYVKGRMQYINSHVLRWYSLSKRR